MRQEHDTKLRRLIKRLEDATWRLAGVEQEIREIEETWGGPPSRVNIIRYEHDPPMWNTVVAARNRYGYLLEEREVLREMIHAIRRKLAEVAG